MEKLDSFQEFVLQDPLIAQQDKLACLKMDYEKLSTYHQQLDIHISQKNTTLKSLTDESKAQGQ